MVTDSNPTGSTLNPHKPYYEDLGKKYFLSYKKTHSLNTDTLIKSEDLKKVYQPFTSIHSDTL